MNKYRYFSISENNLSEVEAAFQVLYHATVEREMENRMGCPGQLSSLEWHKLLTDEKIASMTLANTMIQIGHTLYQPGYFIHNVIKKKFYIDFERMTLHRPDGKLWNWSLVISD